MAVPDQQFAKRFSHSFNVSADIFSVASLNFLNFIIRFCITNIEHAVLKTSNHFIVTASSAAISRRES